MKINVLLKTLQAERKKWDSLLVQADEVLLDQSLLENGMSLKDIIAHITWYENEMVGLVQSRTLAGSELWNLQTDDRNQHILEANRARPADEVMVEACRVYQALIRAIKSLPFNSLDDPADFKEMPADWLPWQIIAENTYKHYMEHTPAVFACLEKRSSIIPSSGKE